MSAAPPAPPPPRPLPMNLYASWEGDRGSPSCVPRLFTLRLQRLMVVQDLAKDHLGSVVIALKLQGSKRILRSNEIPLPPSGAAETDLQLSFSLQYPHFLKRDANRVQVMLQRRKRYKNRTILGYKTLAVGLIDMAEVLQHPCEGALALVLHRAVKATRVPVAEVRVLSLASQPLPQEAKGKLADRSPDLENFSEEEDESFSSEGSEDPLPAQDLFDEEEELPKGKKTRRKIMATSRQPNFKQKVVALLKRVKVSEEGAFALEPGVSRGRFGAVGADLDALYDSLESFNPSDSGAERDDSDSVRSSPKPRLRPFFEGLSQSSSQTEMGSEGPPAAEPRGGRGAPEDGGAEPEFQDSRGDPETLLELGGVPEKLKTPPRGGFVVLRVDSGPPPGRGRRGTPLRERNPESERPPEPPPGQTPPWPRRALWEQLSRALGPEGAVPDSVTITNSAEWGGQWVWELLQAQGLMAVGATGGELPAVLSALLTRLQRLWSVSVLPPRGLKVVAVGGSSFHSALLRAFVRLLGPQSPEWLNCLRFLLVPLGPHPVAQYLGSLDTRYAAAFLDPPWRELFGRSEPPPTEPFSVTGRILSFVAGAGTVQNLPVAEAMLARPETAPDEDSYQKFVPFLGVVTVGLAEDPPMALGDGDEVPPPSLAVPSPSPPPRGHGRHPPPRPPPSAPRVPRGMLWGCRWIIGEGGAKNSLRGTFRSLLVTRLPPPGDPPGSTLTMTLVTREKNKKGATLFLSKRPREPDSKSLGVEGISRLICSPRNPPALLSVTVDGTQWDDIKFFQLAAQWPSRLKHFSVGLFGP
ncbi:phosphofurin acidic cluster sorting protein 1 [Cuculus canorus]|uniref:phosphofurin acidic cluster sorting protein 1 n=1 Tax=Cuculus canorus TaxID=55661 RepID=UPI0023AA5E52|nr:phosphofurin acidic cluster sorting protein 1 [Cuculus canorus]